MVPYEIKKVPEHTGTLLEQLGSKRKFWYTDPKNPKDLLFKQGREGTGEDWAEKVTFELCKILGIPSACYHLGCYGSKQGVISETIVPENGRLVHGDELLQKFDSCYGTQDVNINKEHNIRTVAAYFKAAGDKVRLPLTWTPLPGINTAQGVFAGYLMFDTLISNQDRHHQNWGVIVDGEKIHLAETFDHASSLGRNESDEMKQSCLEQKQRRSVEGYVKKAKSAFFTQGERRRRVPTIDAFFEFSTHCSDEALSWLERLELVTEDYVVRIFERLPDSWPIDPPRDIISDTAVRFAVQMILLNKERLIAARNSLLERKGTL
ncbi:MAG: hypothetical protein ACERJ1_16640 [Halodesulfovibrio sp.]|uniref:hypothetical protein n=1 Tax=Halodesulfovibrio sp. TaxID=1912772 RepID=UPI00359DF43F